MPVLPAFLMKAGPASVGDCGCRVVFAIEVRYGETGMVLTVFFSTVSSIRISWRSPACSAWAAEAKRGTAYPSVMPNRWSGLPVART